MFWVGWVALEGRGCFGGSETKIVSNFLAIIYLPGRHIAKLFEFSWKYSMEN